MKCYCNCVDTGNVATSNLKHLLSRHSGKRNQNLIVFHVWETRIVDSAYSPSCNLSWPNDFEPHRMPVNVLRKLVTKRVPETYLAEEHEALS
jgi:hypothetical protein